jgi:hypothetical protein
MFLDFSIALFLTILVMKLNFLIPVNLLSELNLSHKLNSFNYVELIQIC